MEGALIADSFSLTGIGTTQPIKKTIDGAGGHAGEQLDVQVITLDAVLTRLGAFAGTLEGIAGTNISVLKLDCEGCEPGALLGALTMFAMNPPVFLLTEVRPVSRSLLVLYEVLIALFYAIRFTLNGWQQQDGATFNIYRFWSRLDLATTFFSKPT